MAIYNSLDTLIRPLALDEVSMTGSPESIPRLLDIASSDATPGYIRLKAVEALGRLRAAAANQALQAILEARQVWRWQYPSELRVDAAQALLRIVTMFMMAKYSAAGESEKELMWVKIDQQLNCI